jgi:hypothetical protein
VIKNNLIFGRAGTKEAVPSGFSLQSFCEAAVKKDFHYNPSRNLNAKLLIPLAVLLKNFKSDRLLVFYI